MSEIFVSYSSVDRERIAPLVEALRRQGWVIWWDRAILPGRNWDEEIEQRLKAATCVVVIWTAASVKSEWVRLEAGIARERHKLVPVRFDNVQPPLTFSQIQTASLLGWDNSETAPGFIELMRGIRGLVEAAHPLAPALSIERERTLDAAIARELRVEEAANLIAMVRLPESAGLKAILDANDEFGVSPSDVSSRSFDLTFPAGPDGGPLSVDLTLKIDSPRFDPPSQAKKIRVNPTRDSTVCSFLLTPLVPGKLVVQLEVYQNDIALVSRVLRVSGVPVGVTVARPAYQVTSLPLAVTVRSPLPVSVRPPTRAPKSRPAYPPAPSARKRRSIAPFGASLTALAVLAAVPMYFLQRSSGSKVKGVESAAVRAQLNDVQVRVRVASEYVIQLSMLGVPLNADIATSIYELDADLEQADKAVESRNLTQAAQLIDKADRSERRLTSTIASRLAEKIGAMNRNSSFSVPDGQIVSGVAAIQGPPNIAAATTAPQGQMTYYLDQSQKAAASHDLATAQKMLNLARQNQLQSGKGVQVLVSPAN